MRGRVLVAALFVAIAPVLTSASCDHGGGNASGGSTTETIGARLPVHPACTIFCIGGLSSASLLGGRVDDAIFVSERTAPNPDDHFTPLHPISGPVGNPSLGVFDSVNTDGISEVWQRFPGSPLVYRALAVPAQRTNLAVRTTLCGGYCKDNRGSAWQIQAQDAGGTWSAVFGRGSANSGTDLDSPEVGALTGPQLMTVGIANPQVFACAGGRTQDFRARTTYLIEAMGPGTSGGGAGGTIFTVEDVLNGDRFYTFNSPLQSRTPPTPNVFGPGDPTGTGMVQCAMRQLGDDLTTRELHMIVVDRGHLLHSVATDWGPAHVGGGLDFNRFRTISNWTDVAQALGMNFGTITSAAIVSLPSAISVFFVAESGGIYRVWHTVRYSASGIWRPAQDVLAKSGDAPSGLVDEVHVAAGLCPTYASRFWDSSTTETLLAIWGGSNPNQVNVVRVASPGATQVYSPLRNVPEGSTGGSTGLFTLHSVVVSARPFGDDGKPFP